jgi:serine/threonine-protein kinase
VFRAPRRPPRDNAGVSLVPPRPSPLAPGFRLDRYELICPIAEGGMASVWIARQRGKHGFQKLVAVKTILPKYADEPRFQQMFLDEARIASRIEHANVAQILDVGEQHHVTYLVMEYVDGDSLSRVERAAARSGTPIPLGVALRLIADVCGGLHAAHELRDTGGQPLGVVHRDVSPQNVLVTTQGVAKLIDFGIAKARDRLGGDTNADQLKGKVQYMAPEQALGRPVDRRADVWAVGAVLYHLLSGKAPYEAENDIQTLFLLSNGRAPPALPASVPPAVSSLVMKALALSPDARFASAEAMQTALEGIIAPMRGEATTAAVATYLASLVGDRAAKRKEAIALGLQAAAERERLAEIMRSNTEHNAGTPEPRSAPSAPGIQEINAEPDSSPASSSVPSVMTGTSAALTIEPAPRSRGLRLALVGGVVGASLAVLVVLGVLGLQRGTTHKGSSRPPSSAFFVPPLASQVPAVTDEPATAETPALSAMASATSAPSASASASAGVTAVAPATGPQRPTWPVGRPVGTGRAGTRVNDGF